MKFFFDHCISSRLAKAVHELVVPDHEVVSLRSKFARDDIKDIDWLNILAREGGWTVISGDMAIRTRPRERDVWKAAKLTTFFMARGFTQQPEWEQVRWLIDKWPLIVDMAGRVNPGAAYEVPKRGSKLTAL